MRRSHSACTAAALPSAISVTTRKLRALQKEQSELSTATPESTKPAVETLSQEIAQAQSIVKAN